MYGRSDFTLVDHSQDEERRKRQKREKKSKNERIRERDRERKKIHLRVVGPPMAGRDDAPFIRVILTSILTFPKQLREGI